MLSAVAVDYIAPFLRRRAPQARLPQAVDISAKRATARLKSVEPDGWSFMPLTETPANLRATPRQRDVISAEKRPT